MNPKSWRALETATLLAICLFAVSVTPIYAVVWDGESTNPGDWNVALNWGDDAVGSATDVLPGTLTTNVPATDPDILEDAIIGRPSILSPASVTLNTAPTIGTIGDLRVGDGDQIGLPEDFVGGTGVFNHSAGALATGANPAGGGNPNWSFIGSDGSTSAPSHGTYNLSGDASFTQLIDSAGPNDFDPQFHMGLGGNQRDPSMPLVDLPNEGHLSVAGNASFTVNNFYIGSNNGNYGEVQQSGGTVTANSWVNIGSDSQARGLYNMTGGTFDVVDDGITVGQHEDASGEFKVSGSSIVTTPNLRVGRGSNDNSSIATSTGLLEVAGENVDLTTGILSVGASDVIFTNGEGTLKYVSSAAGVSAIKATSVLLNDGTGVGLTGFAALDFDFSTAPPNTPLELIDIAGTSGGLTGTFTGLPEGTLIPSIGRTITYAFDDGNDIGLSAVVAGVVGDYNGNGTVDDADYAVWLAALGGTTLLNDPTPGTVDDTDYTYWKNNFGATGAGSISAGSIPEPNSIALFALALLSLCGFRRQR